MPRLIFLAVLGFVGYKVYRYFTSEDSVTSRESRDFPSPKTDSEEPAKTAGNEPA